MDISNRRLVEKITETLLAGIQCFARLLKGIADVSLLLLQFRNRSSG